MRIRISRYIIEISRELLFNGRMARNDKFFHLQLKRELFLRIQETAADYQLSISQLARHLLEKSLDLLGFICLPSPYIPRPNVEVIESNGGKTYFVRNVEYTTGE